MGVIRSGLLVIVSVLLFVSFLVGNTLLTISWSLDYDAVKPELVSSVKDTIEDKGMNFDETVNENFEEMQLYCEDNSEYVFNEQGYTFVISCDDVSQGSDVVVDASIGNFVDDVYYKEYGCGFWDCFGEEDVPFFLVSEKAKDYWSSKFYLAILASLVLILLIFFFIENKINLPILVGALIIVSALPFAKLNWVLSFFDKYILGFLTIFFSQSHKVFLMVLIFGIIVLAGGIILKFFGIGFKISGFVSKFQKKDSKKFQKVSKKQEISKVTKNKNIKK